MRPRFILGLMLFSLSFFSFATEEGAKSEEEEYITWARDIWESLDRQTGTIKIEGTGAVLNVPDSFYYLNAEDSKKIIVDVWGNPPNQPILGMLFPAQMSPFDSESWAVTIKYEEDGYVSDEDADEINYNDLLQQMKEDTLTSSKARVKEGYDPVELVGWASPPYYDANGKKHTGPRKFGLASKR